MKPQCVLYTFVDTAYLHQCDPSELARKLCDGGSDLIQLRAKTSTPDEVLRMAESILPITRAANVALVINDYPAVARAVGAEFCHLGQEDFFEGATPLTTSSQAQNSWPRGEPMSPLSPATARASPSPLNGERAGVRGEGNEEWRGVKGEGPPGTRVVDPKSQTAHSHTPKPPLLGLSSHAPAQAERAIAAGAAYIAIGPVYATGTKPSARPVTLEYVRWAAANVQIPWFAIGGINLQNIEQVLEAGAKRICVVSAILNSPDVASACQQFKERLLSRR